MTTEEKKEYIRYRLESADKTFQAAKLLAENKFFNSAVNRLYYAVFYAVNALLVNEGINTQSHSGIRSQFSLHFIKTGRLSKEFGKLFAQLYDWRQKSDYETMVDFSSESVNSLFDPVLEMITEIETVVNRSLEQ